MPSIPTLLQPIRLGNLNLQHRIVLAPLTRVRATKDHVPTPVMAEYYSQRGSMPGSYLIAEATLIAPRASGHAHAPGIWSKEQISGWKKVTEGVHAKGSFIFLQLWALGRAAMYEDLQEDDPSLPYVSSSDVPLPESSTPVPRPLSIEEINEYTDLYATAAKNAVEEAGFDGVEIHSANGYLIDQFLQDVCNKRMDAYGGTVENRCRFALEVVDKVVKTVGAEKTGIRLSPWSHFQGMGMEDPKPTFSYLVQKIKDSYPSFAYIHVIEPRIAGDDNHKASDSEVASNTFLRDIWSPKTFITAGGYERDSALSTAENHLNELVAFGRHFLANPDLPLRIKKDIPLNPYNRDTFYLKGDVSGRGYTDYPFADSVETRQ